MRVGQARMPVAGGGHPRGLSSRRRSDNVLTQPAQKHYHASITLSAEYYHVINRLLVWNMEEKARLTILIDPAKKKAFEELCSSQDMTSSQMVRMLIRQYLDKHGVSYTATEKKKVARR